MSRNSSGAGDRSFHAQSSLPSIDSDAFPTHGAVGSSIHVLRENEKRCALAFRVERRSLAHAAVYLDSDDGWVPVSHHKGYQGAYGHATRCLQSWRSAGLTMYTDIRVVNHEGKVLWKESV